MSSSELLPSSTDTETETETEPTPTITPGHPTPSSSSSTPEFEWDPIIVAGGVAAFILSLTIACAVGIFIYQRFRQSSPDIREARLRNDIKDILKATSTVLDDAQESDYIDDEML
jgi:hypothetical protein